VIKKNRGLETQTRLESPFVVPGVGGRPRRRLGGSVAQETLSMSLGPFLFLGTVIVVVVSK
jgi:hypothetical protein